MHPPRWYNDEARLTLTWPLGMNLRNRQTDGGEEAGDHINSTPRRIQSELSNSAGEAMKTKIGPTGIEQSSRTTYELIQDHRPLVLFRKGTKLTRFGFLFWFPVTLFCMFGCETSHFNTLLVPILGEDIQRLNPGDPIPGPINGVEYRGPMLGISSGDSIAWGPISGISSFGSCSREWFYRSHPVIQTWGSIRGPPLRVWSIHKLVISGKSDPTHNAWSTICTWNSARWNTQFWHGHYHQIFLARPWPDPQIYPTHRFIRLIGLFAPRAHPTHAQVHLTHRSIRPAGPSDSWGLGTWVISLLHLQNESR